MAEENEDLTTSGRILAAISGIGDHREQFLELVSELHAYPSRNVMRATIVDAIPDAPSLAIEDLLGFALAYTEVGIDRGTLDDDDFVDGMLRGPTVDGPALESAKAFLKRLLESHAIMLAARATLAARRRGKMVIRTSIETDVRSVFSPPTVAEPTAFVISHSLAITSTSDPYGDDEKTDVLALDHRDLKALAVQIDQALESQSKLQKQLQELGAVWDQFDFEVGSNQ